MLARLCTIVARNYLPRARVLAQSYLEHHHRAEVTVLVIDDVQREVDPHLEPFDVLRPEDLDLEVEEFHRMAMIYDVVELSTSLKPWLIQHLLDRDPAPVTYLDPDIRVFAPLTDATLPASRHGIVLTPHVTAPIPRDGKLTDEDTILGSGMYNLGFIAVGDRARPFLDFWMERLRRDCRIDKGNHRFVDQRWVDFVPSLFDCKILRDPGYNVAYWNLDHRVLIQEGDGYTVNGAPLRFFHFSGFDPREPWKLSKWLGDRPRVVLSNRPNVQRLCHEYAAAIHAHTRSSDVADGYGFAQLGNGVSVTVDLRRFYREWLITAERERSPRPPDAFTTEGAHELVARATAVVTPGEYRLPPFLRFVHALRADLMTTFPDPEGSDYEPYLDWVEREVAAGQIDGRLVPALRRPPLTCDPKDAESELVRVAGSRANPSAPSRFGVLSRLIRRMMARLNAHESAHRARVDVRLAREVEELKARLEEIDSWLGLRAPSVDGLPSIPRQVAALEMRMVDRLSRLDARVRVLSEDVTRSVESLEQATVMSPAPRVSRIEAPGGDTAVARLQVLDGAEEMSVPGASGLASHG